MEKGLWFSDLEETIQILDSEGNVLDTIAVLDEVIAHICNGKITDQRNIASSKLSVSRKF